MAALGVPKRKDKPQLTLIPEQERSIDYRFEFAIVGESAKTFAEGAVNSEMAEAFRPTAATGSSFAPTPVAESEEDVDGVEPVSPGVVTDPGSPGKQSHKSHGDKLVLFCPIGESSKALARIRFTCIEQFSDSLPLTKTDVAVAQNQAVIFLFYPKIFGGTRSPRSKPPVEEFKCDFASRFAEINHVPKKCRPYSLILAVEPEEEDQEALEEFAKKKNISIKAPPDGGEDTVMEELQCICDYLIRRQKERRPSQESVASIPPLEEAPTQ
eukprot:CAMPEP_0169191118 /NCGR_PEP_ID=MMETSP1016-20121227/4900_1 /TAXON_ID=342587 /ORGANISM="Karlodinium micrum, Strain CCMP2283" /LENGTH=268 /DNA_ID=CAMNT_0009267349 /DNA_START=67 /DNA_END=870 /DNA_ORIENTATION=+